MQQDSFAERWAQKESDLGFMATSQGMVPCTREGLDLPPDALEFLRNSGLPRDAAPCLSFDDTARMPLVWELFGTRADWSEDDRKRLARYRVLGSDGAGNPICVEEPSGVIWLLDHEDWFRSRQFVNSGVPQFAECMLAYMGAEDKTLFRETIVAIDPPALSERAFWWHEAACLAEGSD